MIKNLRSIILVLCLFIWSACRNNPTPAHRSSNPIKSILKPALFTAKIFHDTEKPLAKYDADIPYGVIGSANKLHADNAYDNVFHIKLPRIPNANECVSLQYKLKGVTNHISIARSINDEQATGGYFVRLDHHWSVQKEAIAISALHQGDNVIRFGLPENAGFNYEVKDVSILIGPKADHNPISLNLPDDSYYGEKAYITGVLNARAALFCDGKPITLHHGEFEIIASNPAKSGSFDFELKAVLTNGKVFRREVHFKTSRTTDLYFSPDQKGISTVALCTKAAGLQLSLISHQAKASVSIPSGALPVSTPISITALRSEDLSPVGTDMVNVTGGAKGYRFLPHGKFNKPVQLRLPIDSTLLPPGYTKDDIHTFYFDEISRTWIALRSDTVKTSNDLIASVTPHFTDMIAGIIKVPESPQTQGYTPTSIKDYKAADPSAEIDMIAPPSANSTGDASLSFPIKIPKGRNGIQPNLSLRYNNEGGNGLLGLGWSLPIPAIDIDTRWGVPRYDAALETETYTVSGEQLAPLANRSAFVARVAEKQFYTRIEGAFQKIIRHGSNPTNYWWEVTDKNGMRSSYGGTRQTGVIDGAVLKDGSGNIAHWALVETRDLHDNYVHYFYTMQHHTGVVGGTVQGSQLYISKINYTGSGSTEGLYSVEFGTGSNVYKRSDVEISARLGFKMVTADVLNSITVKFNGKNIRAYLLDYKAGEFSKTLLKAVRVVDGSGNPFYQHLFDYYDDVLQGNGVKTFLGASENWSPANDHIHGDLINPLPGFTDESSALSTSKSSSAGGSLAITIGSAISNPLDKSLTVGGGVGYEGGSNEGLVSMMDINGDGLPDKIFKKNGVLYYRKNLGLSGHGFGDTRVITGINSLSSGGSNTIKENVQAVPYYGFVGYEHSTTTSTTKEYFTDFNGDGLVDLASNGQVYFNHLNANGDPAFELTSANTPSPIPLTSGIDKVFLIPDKALQQTQETNFPLQDAVRMWQAPFDGQITITAPVELIGSSSAGVVDPKQDGVRVSIQLGGSVLWSTTIAAGDFSIKNPSGVSRVTVKKGQRIYFRVQSIYNGNGDVVNWDPVIDYQNDLSPAIDANNRSSAHYKASEDFILSNSNGAFIIKDGTIKIDGTLSKAVTSDTVRLIIKKVSNGSISTLLTKVYNPTEINSVAPALSNVAVHQGDTLKFFVQTDSYIDRTAAKWVAHYSYTTFSDGAPVTNANGSPAIEVFVAPDNRNFNDWRITASPFSRATKDRVAIKVKIAGNSAATGDVTFTIKGKDTVYAKQFLKLSNGVIVNNPDSIRLVLNPNQTYFFDYHAADRTLAENLSQPQVIVHIDSISGTPPLLSHHAVIKTINANLYATPADLYLGTFFRGWGQFSFKGVKDDISPLNESKLTTNQYQNYPTDPAKYQDTTSLKNLTNPSGSDFTMMSADAKRNLWVGLDTSIYVSAGKVSSSRLFLHDVSVDSLMTGASLQAAEKISTSTTQSYTLGFILNDSHSSSKNTTNLDMIDMNGDHYPDILNESIIQYSQSSGSRDQSAYSPYNLGPSSGKGNTDGISLGGNFIEDLGSVKPIEKAVEAIKEAEATFGSITGSASTSKQESNSAWIDINGDGLPDKVYSNGLVALNLGYKFAAAENWGIAAIDQNKSSSEQGGYGYNFTGGSWMAGFGLNRSNGTGTFTLSDINGDGLIDQVTTDGVQLNTGNGFTSKISWSSLSDFSNSVSTGESIDAAYTTSFIIPIPFFPIKICINPSINAGHGISRERDQISDIDGDGFPDVLHSDNDGDLQVRRSLIGRTNMLKTVHRPMNGYFTVDYQRIGNTYQLPQNKWVLSSVELFDGMANNANGVDTMHNRFAYTNGIYNRHEREFYGFGTVTSNHLNTAKQNAIYRTTVQQFINNSYYTKNLLKSEVLQDANGNKFTETDNLYDLRQVADSVRFPALVQTTKLSYDGQPTAGQTTAMKFDYDAFGNATSIYDQGDGTPDDLVMATVTYQDNPALYIKNIPASVVVNTTEGIKRKRTTAINNFGDITQIKQFLADGTAAVYDMKYDSYGNLSQITRPANVNGERMFYAYAYDNTVNTYVTKVTDAYGYSSSSTYDYRFGIATNTVSMNNEPMRILLDSIGRISSVTGPYELASGDTTIRFEYFPNAAVPYAITHHFDPQYGKGNDINIITFMDGLGRAIQVKKQVSLFTGKNRPDQVKMVVSGRTLYDAFGRAVTNYYPVTEAIAGNNQIFNATLGNIKSNETYDVLDRPLTEVLADGATTKMAYTITNGLEVTTTTDALRHGHETLTDVKGRKREEHALSGPTGTITTKFSYDALSELIKVVDDGNNSTSYTYDNLGRKLSATYPDAGLISFVYDLAGNLTQKITAQMRKDIPKGGAINYQYNYERLTGIDYPEQYQNKVTYKYGPPATGQSALQDDRAGRMILQEDASGGLEFYYGKLGEINKQIRTVMVSKVFYTTYVSQQQYDTWNRVTQMTYPDGETINYHYNHGGTLDHIAGTKEKAEYKYVNQLGYDEYEQRVYLQYGNGTETHYAYDSLRRRLVNLKAKTASGTYMMDNNYGYDAVSNILSIVNGAKPAANPLDGTSSQSYKYDGLYRLVSATGAYHGADSASYTLNMEYDNLYNITTKKLSTQQNALHPPAGNYTQNYTYGGTVHQATNIGLNNYTYDLNGNQLTNVNKLGNNTRENFWDEENRLQRTVDNGLQCLYTYDAGGERVIKSSGGIQANYINSAIAGTINHYDNYTVYVSPYLVCRRTNFTKHIYIEGQRIATKIGNGLFTNISFPQSALSAGGINYISRAKQLESDRIAYYRTQGNGGLLVPGPPTNKLFYYEPINSLVAPPVLVDSTTATPPGWPGNMTPPPTGPPVTATPIPTNDSVKAGYGFLDTTKTKIESNQYFYHPDHLGSTAYVTDAQGQVSQHEEYVPFGETYYDKHIDSYASPYLFNAKELDAETGLYYYGARYYNPQQSQWISTDPMVDKYAGLSPYNYALNNPVRMVDADGKESEDSNSSLSTTSGALKGIDQGLNQRYSIYKMNGQTTGGDTKFGIKDNTLGRIKNGQRMGLPVVRFDMADEKTPFPHINGPKGSDIHIPIIGGAKTLKAIEMGGKMLNFAGNVAKPLAIASDIYQVSNAIEEDGGTIGKNTLVAGGGVAGGWSGAAVGAEVGAEMGATLGLLGGPFMEITVPVGGFLGGIAGGIYGGVHGSSQGSKIGATINNRIKGNN